MHPQDCASRALSNTQLGYEDKGGMQALHASYLDPTALHAAVTSPLNPFIWRYWMRLPQL